MEWEIPRTAPPLSIKHCYIWQNGCSTLILSNVLLLYLARLANVLLLLLCLWWSCPCSDISLVCVNRNNRCDGV